MKTFQYILFFLVALVMISCQKENKRNTIINPNDYNSFLMTKETKALDFANYEIDFWQNKFDKTPNQITYLNKIASNYNSLFEITGNIDNLYKAEKLLVQSNEAFKYTNVGTIRSLARNYIMQHRFKEALELANKALTIGEGKEETRKLLFDVQMELGNYETAEEQLIALNHSKNFKDFDFLIRLAKWNDHLGDLETAITMMEKAVKAAEFNDDKILMVWAYSNLGDMYGHAGKIKEAYSHYLRALQINPEHSYSLKGIAWIVFSHEKNTKEADRIINIISKKHNSPDFYLMKSEIAEYENNYKLKSKNISAYFNMLKENKYGAMYNKYNVLIFADEKITAQKALEIAKIEVNHRPTPDSYDLLAWSYYNLGDYKKALEIAQKHVAGKSFEPELNYHLAMIYKANKMNELIEPIKKDLLASTFELGPSYKQKIGKL
ncbi:MAG: tetratricopeptide repeat protein [Bacteroidota bacterium]